MQNEGSSENESLFGDYTSFLRPEIGGPNFVEQQSQQMAKLMNNKMLSGENICENVFLVFHPFNTKDVN